MRHGLIVGFRRGTKVPVVISGPEVPIVEQREKMRLLKGQAEHSEFERAVLITLDGGTVMRTRFDAPAETPASPPETPEAPVTAPPVTPVTAAPAPPAPQPVPARPSLPSKPHRKPRH